MLERLATQVLPPNDWKQLARTCLSGGDYLLWKTEFVEQCQVTADINRAQNNPIDFDMLAGEGAYRPLISSCTMCQELILKLMRQLRERGEDCLAPIKKSEDLSKVRQGPNEPHQDFVSRLLEATGKLVNDTDAGMMLVKTIGL